MNRNNGVSYHIYHNNIYKFKGHIAPVRSRSITWFSYNRMINKIYKSIIAPWCDTSFSVTHHISITKLRKNMKLALNDRVEEELKPPLNPEKLSFSGWLVKWFWYSFYLNMPISVPSGTLNRFLATSISTYLYCFYFPHKLFFLYLENRRYTTVLSNLQIFKINIWINI